MFNGNAEGIAPNNPCYQCPNRTPYCHSQCEKYKEWQLIQKQYSNKVKWIRKQNGFGVNWNSPKAYIYKKKGW